MDLLERLVSRNELEYNKTGASEKPDSRRLILIGG